MKAVQHTDPAEFWQLAEPIYAADPLRNTIALTVLPGLVTAPEPDAEPPLLITLDDNGHTLGAAFRTPPWPLGVSGVPDEAIPELVRFLRGTGYPIPGVNGPLGTADRFADTWLAEVGGTKQRVIALRLYRLGDLTTPDVAGAARRCADEDVPLAAAFRAAFAEETPPHNIKGFDHAAAIRRTLAAGGAHLIWFADHAPVAYAAVSHPTSGMSRVGPVYTPPEHRNHGYGSAVTAAAAQWALDAGAEHVILYTDLANPTSNAIYQKLGFVPHHDAVEYRFLEDGPTP